MSSSSQVKPRDMSLTALKKAGRNIRRRPSNGIFRGAFISFTVHTCKKNIWEAFYILEMAISWGFSEAVIDGKENSGDRPCENIGDFAVSYRRFAAEVSIPLPWWVFQAVRNHDALIGNIHSEFWNTANPDAVSLIWKCRYIW